MSVHVMHSPDLVAVRRKKGLSLEQIAHDTKINVNYLQAIEDGSFERMPGGIYTTSYIRQYAQAIDYEEGELLEYYYRKTGRYPEPLPMAPIDPVRRGFAQLFQLLRVFS